MAKLWMFNIIKGGINFVLLQKITYFTIILYSYVCTRIQFFNPNNSVLRKMCVVIYVFVLRV